LACLLIGTAAAQCTGSSANLPAKECNAWQDFYDNLDGPNWTVFCKDKRDDPCSCNSGLGDPCKGGPSDHFVELMKNLGDGPVPNPWHEPDAGVCCQNRTDGLHITQLAFALNGLNGTVPDSINDLEELDNLSACGNKMTGQLPDMSNTKLQYLRLYQNEFTGTVPATLNNNTALTFLSLGDNNLEGVVPDLTGLSKLTDLYLDCNNLSGTVADDKDRQWKFSGKCFLNAHGALLEKCSKGRDDNAFDCPLPAGADKNCHATCK
jgi:hypothetical protein